MEEADGAVFLGVDGQVVHVDADEPMCATVVSWALQGGGGARSAIAGSGAAAGEGVGFGSGALDTTIVVMGTTRGPNGGAPVPALRLISTRRHGQGDDTQRRPERVSCAVDCCAPATALNLSLSTPVQIVDAQYAGEAALPATWPIGELPERVGRDAARRLCVPVIAQPRVDIAAGNTALALFVDIPAEGAGQVEWQIVYAGESAWSRRSQRVHRVATSVYKANRHRQWKRTTDVNKFFWVLEEPYAADGAIRVAGLSSDAYAGDQQWFSGDRLLLRTVPVSDDRRKPPLRHRSAVDGRQRRMVPLAQGELVGGGRPVVYACTCNHLMHLVNNNDEHYRNDAPEASPAGARASFEMDMHLDLPVFHGTKRDAERFAQQLPHNRSSSVARGMLAALRIGWR